MTSVDKFDKSLNKRMFQSMNNKIIITVEVDIIVDGKRNCRRRSYSVAVGADAVGGVVTVVTVVAAAGCRLGQTLPGPDCTSHVTPPPPPPPSPSCPPPGTCWSGPG